MAQNVKVDFRWNKRIPDIVNDSTGGDKAALFLATTWHRLYDQFVPMRTGMLAHDAVRYSVENGNGIIHHAAPYARRLYEGHGMRFSGVKHPLASAQWDQAAKAAGQADNLASEYQAYLKRGGG